MPHQKHISIKKVFGLFGIFFCAILLITASANFAYAAGVPSVFSYQGRLTDTGGNPLGGNGTQYYFKFSLWDSATVGSGSKVWPTSSPTSYPYVVKNGYFNVNIGDTDAGYPDTLDFDFNTAQKVYLQVEVSSDNSNFEPLSPRTLVTASAFSKVAGQVNGTADSSFGTSTPFANTLISALSTAVNKTVLAIKGIAGQVADLFNIQDSNGNSLFSVSPQGNVGIAGNLNLTGSIITSTSTIGNYLSSNATGLSYAPSTGIFSLTSGYNIPLTASTTDWNTAFINRITSASSPLSISGNVISISNTPTFASTTLSNFTAGSIPFFSTGGALAQNNSNLFWDNTNGRLGVGTTTPSSLLTVAGAGLFTGTITANNGTITGGAGNMTITAGTGASRTLTLQTTTSGGTPTNAVVFNATQDATFGHSVTSGYNVTVSNTGSLVFAGFGSLYSNVQKRFVFTDNNGTDLTRFQFGGTTSSFPGFNFTTGTQTISAGLADGTDGGTFVASGKLGVGTTTPSTKLQVYGTAGTDIFDVASSTGSSLFHITQAGNVGIGTASPTALLDVNGAGKFTSLSTASLASNGNYMTMSSNRSWTFNIATAADGNSGNSFILNYQGVELLRALPSNNYLGVHNSNPQYQLDVGGTFRASATSTFAGNVGIGTTTPTTALSVVGGAYFNGTSTLNDTGYSSSLEYSAVFGRNASNPDAMQNVVIGSGSFGGNAVIRLKSDANRGYIGWRPNGNAFFTGTGDAKPYHLYTNGSAKVAIDTSGNVGIGTTTPSAQLHTTGTVRFGALTGAGANLIVDANGNVTVSSDERLKNVQGNFNRGLSDVMNLNPIVFKWKPETGYDTENTYAGFSAQNVQLAIPEAVGTDAKGYLTLADRPILATVVNAVKEMWMKITDMATFFKTKEIQTDKLCVGETCVTEAELKDLLQNSGTRAVSATGGGASEASADSSQNNPTASATSSAPASDFSNDTASTTTGSSETSLGELVGEVSAPNTSDTVNSVVTNTSSEPSPETALTPEPTPTVVGNP